MWVRRCHPVPQTQYPGEYSTFLTWLGPHPEVHEVQRFTYRCELDYILGEPDHLRLGLCCNVQTVICRTLNPTEDAKC